MPNIVCESIAVDWERSAWRSGHGTPVNEMDFASTLRYQRYLNARLHRHRGVDMVLEAQARRDLWDRELRDRHVEYPDSTRPDALLPRFHLISRPEHRELPFAQCAFTTAQVELYHLARHMAVPDFLREVRWLEGGAGRKAQLLWNLMYMEALCRSDIGALQARLAGRVNSDELGGMNSDELCSSAPNAWRGAASEGSRCALGAADDDGEFACLAWALNALGALVPTNVKGPFRALKHGNQWLAELGLQLVRQPQGPSGPGGYVKWEPPRGDLGQQRDSCASGHFTAARVHAAGITVTDRRRGRFVSEDYQSLEAIPSVLTHKRFLLQEVQPVGGDVDPLGGAGGSELDGGAASAREPIQARAADACDNGPFQITQELEKVLTGAGLDAAIQESMRVFTHCEPNQPAAPPHRSPGEPDLNIVHDGLCLYHCGLASEDMNAWALSQKSTGYGFAHEQVRSEEDRAKQFRARMKEIIARDRGQEAADRLEGSSSDSYPGLDDMEAFCEVIQGQTVVQSDTLCQIAYGDRYPLAMFIRHHQVSGADHFDLIQSWRPVAARGREASGGASSSSRGAATLPAGEPAEAARPRQEVAASAEGPTAGERTPAGDAARRARRSSQGQAAAAAQTCVADDGFDAGDLPNVGDHADALEKRLAIPGAAAPTSDFDALFGEVQNYATFIRSLVAEPKREDDSILATTANYRKWIAAQQPTWSPWLRRLAMGALCVYRLRFSDIYTRELVLLLHVILGDEYLRGHDGVAYFWNNKLGCFDKFDGLLPESIYSLMKSYLLSLEGMFRSFTGDVWKNDSAILDAMSSSYDRQGKDDKKARQSWIDNAVFNYGSKTLSKGKGKGKGHVRDDGAGEDGKGNGKGKIMRVDHAGGDPFAEDEGVAPVPDEPEEQHPGEPWYIFQAKSIAKVGHALQSKVKTGDLISYYCEWCSTPKPDVKGFAFIDVAFLYDTQAGLLAQATAPEQRQNLYIGLPHSLLSHGFGDPVLKAAIQRVQTFYRQTYWANAAAFKCCQAAIALAKRGMNVDQVFFFWGSGGVGLSLTTSLLSNMLGSNLHRYFDPQVFYMDEEMRKQVESLVGSIVMTAQEKPEGMNKSFREDLFKKMATADGIFGRLPYAVLTKVITLIGWKRMELNKLITFAGVPETAFDAIFRRSLLVRIRSKFLDQEWISNFLPDSEKYGVFPRQPDLREFMQSGPAGLAANILQCQFESQNDKAASRRALDDYTLRGGDHGIMETYMRAACNLPARSSRRASSPGIDLVAGAEEQTAPSSGDRFRAALLRYLLDNCQDRVVAAVFNVAPQLIPEGKGRAAYWKELEDSPEWATAVARGKEKAPQIPILRTAVAYPALIPPPDSPPPTCPELLDIAALREYLFKYPARSDNALVVVGVKANGFKKEKKAGRRTSAALASRGVSLLEESKKLKNAERDMESVISSVGEQRSSGGPGAVEGSPSKRRKVAYGTKTGLLTQPLQAMRVPYSIACGNSAAAL